MLKSIPLLMNEILIRESIILFILGFHIYSCLTWNYIFHYIQYPTYMIDSSIQCCIDRHWNVFDGFQSSSILAWRAYLWLMEPIHHVSSCRIWYHIDDETRYYSSSIGLYIAQFVEPNYCVLHISYLLKGIVMLLLDISLLL